SSTSSPISNSNASTATGYRWCCSTARSTGTGGSRRSGCAGIWPGSLSSRGAPDLGLERNPPRRPGPRCRCHQRQPGQLWLRATIGGGSKTPHLAAHLDALGLTGPECVLIGDSVDDAHAADAVGAACVLYSGGFTDPERLAETGRPVAHTLTEAVRLATGVRYQ